MSTTKRDTTRTCIQIAKEEARKVKEVNLSKLGKLNIASSNPSYRKKEPKKKNHIVCFTCRERRHYHTKCLKKNMAKEKKTKGEWKKKVGYLFQGELQR